MQKSVSTKGKRFGGLVVLDEVLRKTHGGKRRKSCYCLCDCGTKKWVRQSSLISGSTKSCGCLQSKMASERAKQKTGTRVNKSGQRFGLLTVTKEWKREQSGKSYVTKWKCKCDCGVDKWVQNSVLSRTQSCGCLHRQKASQRKRIEPGKAAFNRIFQQYKLRAKRKNIIFSLTTVDFLEITKCNCHYCGACRMNVYVAEGENGKFVYNGIDRVDNKRGYTIDNCVPCCQICNRAKATLTIIEFVEWVKKISTYMLEKTKLGESNANL